MLASQTYSKMPACRSVYTHKYHLHDEGQNAFFEAAFTMNERNKSCQIKYSSCRNQFIQITFIVGLQLSRVFINSLAQGGLKEMVSN